MAARPSEVFITSKHLILIIVKARESIKAVFARRSCRNLARSHANFPPIILALGITIVTLESDFIDCNAPVNVAPCRTSACLEIGMHIVAPVFCSCTCAGVSCHLKPIDERLSLWCAAVLESRCLLDSAGGFTSHTFTLSLGAVTGMPAT